MKNATILHKLLSLNFFNRFLRLKSLNNTILLSLIGALTGIVSEPRANIRGLKWFDSQERKCLNRILATNISYIILYYRFIYYTILIHIMKCIIMLLMCYVFRVSLENARKLCIYCVGTENDSA